MREAVKTCGAANTGGRARSVTRRCLRHTRPKNFRGTSPSSPHWRVSSKPHQQAGQIEHSTVRSGGLVVASGDNPILFEPVGAAFDHIAAPVCHKAATGAAGWPADRHVRASWQRYREYADEHGSRGWNIPCRPRPAAAASTTRFRHPDPRHHLGEHHAIVDVARSRHERQRPAVAVTSQMDFVVGPPRERPMA